ncbi:secreted glycosyl hydrolase [Pyrenophora tritici-repentis]|uniref:Secreted glycosyl hydrolase n=2 Tax=Pyrenophora tritici-repentis TaxID=45151 RepID=A0A2W1DI98_9PLEO|nr:secreted glycosyl hydrolase [Pyrenophora tritici-repentis Pt-1C-BFP]KAA8622542.1 Secreted glycosyl hydrolase [Pyrenophora tritici-repentis]EDU45883.1 secreted glycosyl hydrolase [Pyrenophora tritici-repentis Pt-1C-BFP]KAF7451529.1 Secreted glycosyl hydrolase [Pyrenophora tritici-repentis]KAF7575361.1 ThuA multi-domain protein [Pyrenophora tritici-repentis]KAG9385889.1 Secreted glycosyl hydrolase [Pyrenophora tritici-repentis]
MSTPQPFNILVFSKTTGYRHDSIPAGINLFHTLSTRTKSFNVTATEDAAVFTPTTLSAYTVIVLLQNIGPALLTADQLSAFHDWVRAGGGVVAIHGAAAGMPEEKWYTDLIGASFDMHPEPEPGTVVPEEDAQKHYIMSCCGGREAWMDEWYNFHTHPRENKNLNVLLRGDPKTFKGGKHGDDHPLVWCQEFEGGRVFFTALGHFDDAYEDEWFVGQVERGLMWAARKE